MASTASGTTLRQIDRLFGTGSVAGLSDRELLDRFEANRDEAAFEALVARHGAMVAGVCRSVLRDDHAAEDAFQATFLTLARRAGALRSRDSLVLGGWLYRVASRTALQARADAERRRRRERQAAVTTTGGGSNPWADWLPVLHEEIERLPERQRAPIVLCYLQGLTYEQAADALRWTLPTLRCRLAKARDRLRGKLVRRGMGTAGALAALAAGLDARPAAASVPAGWAQGAIRIATGGVSASTTAAALSERLLEAMGWTRLKEALTLACTLGAVLAIGIYATSAGPTGPDRPPVAAPADRPGPAPGFERAPGGEPGATVAVHGRVLGPDGKPMAGASLRLDHFLYLTNPPPDGGPSAVTASDGRYTFVAPRELLEKFSRSEARAPYRLVATAPGFGPGWADVANSAGVLDDVTVRLAADDLPIDGRILDLEGQPVAGAEIVTSNIYAPPAGDLTPWIEAMKANPTGPYEGGLVDVPFSVKRTTGPDGRFRLTGVGRERVVMFTVVGPGVALTRTFAMTKEVPALQSANTHTVGPRTMTFHGARFDFALAPSKIVAGTMTDLETGAPLSGVQIHGMAHDPRSSAHYHEIASVTDAQGRYRLTGMAKAEKYQLFVSPGAGQPYCNATFTERADTPGLEPATIDLKLKRGVLVRGRITDKRTGQPVKGGSVASFALRDNPHVDEYPGFKQAYETRTYPDDDGRFTIAALPGRGMLGVYGGGSERYLRGVGAEALQKKGSHTSLPAYPGFPFAHNYNLIATFGAQPDSEPVTLALELDPGRVLSATVVDPEGKPIAGCLAFGTSSFTYWARRPLDSATFELSALDPRDPRRLMLFHEGRRLGGTALITEKTDGPLTITLQPCGLIKGRLVDEDGQPRTSLQVVNAGFLDNERDEGVFHRPCTVDRDGRFQIEAIPGLVYTAGAQTERGKITGKVFTRLTLGPSEVKDVGDVTVK